MNTHGSGASCQADIAHESAGHAPFIVAVDHAEFLQRFGAISMKAVSTGADMAVYEAIRQLSIVKECPASDPAVNESVLQTRQGGLSSYPDEWLLRSGLLIICNEALRHSARSGLETLAQRRPDLPQLIGMSLSPQ